MRGDAGRRDRSDLGARDTAFVPVVLARVAVVLVSVLALALGRPAAPVAAQQVDGGLGHIAAGATLGALSGGAFGLLGSFFPCNRTGDGRLCVVSAASTGAALGIAMGGTIASQDRDALWRRAEHAGIGLGAGAAVGLVLQQAVERYDWRDVATASLLGGAIGAAPEGALIGAGAGLALGSLAWVVIPAAGVQEMVLITLVGMALGGMVDWGVGAADKPPSTFGATFSIVF